MNIFLVPSRLGTVVLKTAIFAVFNGLSTVVLATLDFNCILDAADRISLKTDSSNNALNHFVTTFNLVDAWKHINPDHVRRDILFVLHWLEINE